MQQWKTGTLTAHGTILHYYRTGGEKPPLILLHGITDDGLCWSPAAEVLAEDYDVVMVDQRGHGKSDAPDEGYDYVTMAKETAGLIRGLGLENPVVMGHSMGAMVALTMGGLYPDLPRMMVLEDPPAFWAGRIQADDEVRSRMGTWFQAVKRQTRDELLAFAQVETPDWPDAEIQPWADAKHRFSLEIIRLLDAKNAVPADFPALLRKITCPALLITADPKHGAIVTDETASSLQKAVPHLKRAHIPGAGHNIRREQFNKYLEVVQEFLKV